MLSWTEFTLEKHIASYQSSTWAHFCARLHTHTHTHAHAHACTRTHACMHAHTQAHMHTHRHTHALAHSNVVRYFVIFMLTASRAILICTQPLSTGFHTPEPDNQGENRQLLHKHLEPEHLDLCKLVPGGSLKAYSDLILGEQNKSLNETLVSVAGFLA